jgi:hypothetical protein
MNIEDLKRRVRLISGKYTNREDRARRVFIEEGPQTFDRDRQFEIRTAISQFYEIPYSAVHFCGSAHLGFSAQKNRLFIPAESDLDAACADTGLFQAAWQDVVSTSRAFTDQSCFRTRRSDQIKLFMDQILRRGMIKVEMMPYSKRSRSWVRFQDDLSRQHSGIFRKVTIAIYINEYAFCWKQDSTLAQIAE